MFQQLENARFVVQQQHKRSADCNLVALLHEGRVDNHQHKRINRLQHVSELDAHARFLRKAGSMLKLLQG